MKPTRDDLLRVFEAGEHDGYWCLEQDDQGQIYVTSNALTQERVTPRLYHGWDLAAFAQMRDGFRLAGVPAAVADRYLEQAGADLAAVAARDRPATAAQIAALQALAEQFRDRDGLSASAALDAVIRQADLTLVGMDDQVELYRLGDGSLVNCWREAPEAGLADGGIGFDDQITLLLHKD